MHACVCAHTHTKAEIVAGALGLGMGEQVTKEGAEEQRAGGHPGGGTSLAQMD